MTVPHTHAQLAAFHPAYADPVDTSSQVDRFPPDDAYCPALDNGVRCIFPYCTCYAPAASSHESEETP